MRFAKPAQSARTGRGGGCNHRGAGDAACSRAAGSSVRRRDRRRGAIKKPRPAYTSSLARKSGATFDLTMPELGYIAVHDGHRGKGLLERLTKARRPPRRSLFATTDNDRMKRVLRRHSFERRGRQWQGNRGMLSLWIWEGRVEALGKPGLPGRVDYERTNASASDVRTQSCIVRPSRGLDRAAGRTSTRGRPGTGVPVAGT
jgi:hypothetical protein